MIELLLLRYNMSHLAAPSKEAIKSLYKNMLHSSQSFSSYNFRQYFVKRTEDTFKQLNVSPKHSMDPATTDK